MMQTTLSENNSGYILMGPKHLVEAARIQATLNPIMCGNFEMKEQLKEKWLRDFFSKGLKESVQEAIKSSKISFSVPSLARALGLPSWRLEQTPGR